MKAMISGFRLVLTFLGLLLLLGSCNYGITNSLPSSNTVTLLSGVVVSPSAESPWPDIPVYRYPLEINKIKIGDELSMGLDVTPRLGQYWTANYTQDYIKFEESIIIYLDPEGVSHGTNWFRFKAIKEGSAFIIYDLIGVSKDVFMRLIFSFNISEQ